MQPLLNSIRNGVINFKKYIFNKSAEIPVVNNINNVIEFPIQKIKEPIKLKTEEEELREYVITLFEKYKHADPSWPKKFQPFMTIRDIMCDVFSVKLTKNEVRKIMFKTLLEAPQSQVRTYFYEGCKIYEEFILEKEITKNVDISKILEQAKNRTNQIINIECLSAVQSQAMNDVYSKENAINVYTAMFECRNNKPEFNLSQGDIILWLKSKNINVSSPTVSKIIKSLHTNGLIDKIFPRKYRKPEEGYCIPAFYRISDRWEKYGTDEFITLEYPMDKLKIYNDNKKSLAIEEAIKQKKIKIAKSNNTESIPHLAFIIEYLKRSKFTIQSLKSGTDDKINMADFYKDCKTYCINKCQKNPDYNTLLQHMTEIFPSVARTFEDNIELGKKVHYYNFPNAVKLRMLFIEYYKQPVNWDIY